MDPFKKSNKKSGNSGVNYKNPWEGVKSLGSSTVKKSVSEMGSIATGIFDQLMGASSKDSVNERQYPKDLSERAKNVQSSRVEKKKTIFDFTTHYEENMVRQQIKELTQRIKEEMKAIKSKSESLDQEILEVEKVVMSENPKKPGIYHVRFLELVLRILKTLRLKIGESKTWLQAMVSRKKKRGSLFAHLSKKKGTQYSLSQELQIARQKG